MKQKLLILMCIVCIGAIFFLTKYVNQRGEELSNEYQQVQYVAQVKTITKQLTCAAEIQSAETKTLSLSTSKKFKTACVEVGDNVKEGDHLVMYTDGTYLNAPFDGVVTAMSLPTVNKKATSSNTITVKSTANILLDIEVNQADIADVYQGQTVYLYPGNNESNVLTGEINYVSGVAEYQFNNSIFTATGIFENDGSLKIGMSATCSIVLQQVENVVVVPVESVSYEGGSYYISIVDGEQTIKQEVEIGLSDENDVQIISGLSEGQTITYQVKVVSAND